MAYDPVDYMDLQKSVMDAPSSSSDDIYAKVQEMQAMTRDIPVMAKAQDPTRGVAPGGPTSGPKAVFFDPLSLQYSLGYKDRRYSLTYDTLKRISAQVSIVGSIINTRIAQIASFSEPYRFNKSLGFRIKHKSPDHETTDGERDFIEKLEAFILDCGEPGKQNPFTNMKRSKFEGFIKKIVRDTLTFDQLGFEVVPRNNKIPFEFWAADASTLRIASPDQDAGIHFSYHDRNNISPRVKPHRFDGLYAGQQYGDRGAAPGMDVRYVQVVNGQIENVFGDNMAFGVRNPRSDIYIQGYGYGEIEQLITIITSVLYAEEYNRRFFCVSGNLSIVTDQGLQRIENCYKLCLSNQGEMQMAVGTKTQINQAHGKIWTGSKWSPYRVYKTGVKPLARTKLETGYTIETSPGHRFRVIPVKSSTGLPEWVKQEDLSPGDRVLVPSSLIEYDAADTSFEREGDNSGRSFEIEDAKDDLWEILGWWLGDGSVGRSTNDFLIWHYRRNSEEHIADQHKKVLESYELEVKKGTVALTGFAKGSSGRSGPRLKVSQNTFVAYLEHLGLVKEGTTEKQIPETIFSESVENRCAFIRGYFGADGCTNKAGTLLFSMRASHKASWIKPFQQLLLTLGIRSRWQKSPGHLVVTDTDKFNQLVGFIHDHKRDRSHVNQKLKGAGERLHPALCQRIAKHVMNSVFHDKLSNSQKKMVQANVVGRERMSAQKFREILEIVGVRTYDDVLSYYQVKIKSVEQTDLQIPMFDIEVFDDDHQFVGDGAVVHNSQGAHPKGMLNFKGDNWTPDQLEAFKRQWVSQVAGTENCVAGDTVVWTPEGASTLEDTLSGKQEKEISIWTGTEWCSALAYRTKKPKQLVHTKLRNGLALSTSPDHRFRVLGESGPEWRRQENLEIGDYVLVNKNSIGSSGAHPSTSIVVNGSRHKLGKTDRLPPTVTIKYARLVREASQRIKVLSNRERINLNSIICGLDVCSLSCLLTYMGKVNVEVPSWMDQYYFEPVIEIDRTGVDVPMYDVSVYNEEHQFIASGIACHNSWKTPITQSEGMEWIDLQRSNQEMGFQGWLEYLIKITCAIFLIDPAEINFDLHGGVQQTPLFESSQEWKLKASRDRGLKPLLRFFSSLINEYIVDPIDDHFMFEYAGLDELTEQEKHELLKEQISSYKTLNEGRRELDLPDIPGGVGDIPLNPTLIQLLQMQQQREDTLRQEQEQQQQQQQQDAEGEQPVDPEQAPTPKEEQEVRHLEDKHPLEVQKLQQEVEQGALDNAGMVPPEQAMQGDSPVEQGAPPEEQGAPPEQAMQGAPPRGNGSAQESSSQDQPDPAARPAGDSKRQYANIFGKSATMDDFIEFMRSKMS